MPFLALTCRRYRRLSLFSHAIRLRVKRGAAQELLLAIHPSPPGLDHGTRPGLLAAVELTQGPGLKDAEHQEGHGREGETRTGLAKLHYNGGRTSLARLEELTPDSQDKFSLWIHQSLRHETLAHSLHRPAAATFSSFHILRQLLAR